MTDLDDFLAPDLAAPFPTRTSPHIETAQQQLVPWAMRHNLLEPGTSTDDLTGLAYAKLAGRWWPTVSEDHLALATQWILWMACYDDAHDEGIGVTDPARWRKITATVENIMRGHPTRHDSPIVHALSDLWERTSPLGDGHWAARYADSMASLTEAHHNEAAYRMTNTIPEPEQYATLRRAANGLLPHMALIEALNGAPLKPLYRDSCEHHFLTMAAIDVLSWTNDLFSARKEAARGEVHNLVFVLMKHEGLAARDAVLAVKQRLDTRLVEFDAAARAFCALGKNLAPNAQTRYVEGLRNWITGLITWHRSETTRQI